jgi:HK97 family phage portal protein
VGLYENISALRSVEKRTTGGFFQPWLNPYMRFDIGGPVSPSKEMYGTESALGLPALYAGTKILAESAASLPLRAYTKTGGSTQLYTGPTMFDDPSELGTIFDWIFMAMVSLILHGNAWGLIIGKDAYGFPKGIEWLPPQDVIVHRDTEYQFNPLRTKVYVYGREVKWFGPDKEIIHIGAFPLPGQLESLSLIRALATTIMSGKQTEQYGLSWYQAGGFPPGILKNEELEVDPEQAAQIRSMLVATLRRREPLVIGRDWEYTPVTVPPSEAQFIDAMQLNATHIGAVLNLPPDRLGGKRGDSLTYTTVEMSALQILDALRPWLIRLEQAFSRLLPKNREVRFFRDALLDTDLKTRTEIQVTKRKAGLITANEIRESEDRPPLPGKMGDDGMALDLMIALGTRAGAIPKSMAGEVTFLMDHAASTLEKLQSKGLAASPPVDPTTGKPQPGAPSPQQTIGSMVAAYARKYPEHAYDQEMIELREVADQLDAVFDPTARNGAWIPSVRSRVENLESV